MTTKTGLAVLGRIKISSWLIVIALLLLSSLLIVYSTSSVFASEPIAYGYRDFSYPSGTGANSEVTAEKPESKLWWNDGSWWGSLWSTSGNAYHIHRLDLATQSWTDTGTSLDDRKDSRADVLWDDASQKLYIVSHIWSGNGESASPGERGELFRYSYNSGVYLLDAGFPVEVNEAKTETLVLAKDSTGTLWVTYVQEDADGKFKVWVNSSLGGDDSVWGIAFVLPVAGADDVTEDDISSIISYNGKIGVMWSNQNVMEMHFAVHTDGAGTGVWQGYSAYTNSADDHINLKSLQTDGAGSVYAVVKTSVSSALIVLLSCTQNECTSSGDWEADTVYDNSYGSTRPILLLDTQNRRLYVFARNKDPDMVIYYKSADMDNIQFAGGIGTPFIKSLDDDNINDPTSTKQNVNGATGIVVLASDSKTKYYFHNYLSLGAAPTDTPTVTPTPSDTPTPTATTTSTPTFTPSPTLPSPGPETDTPTPTFSPTATLGGPVLIASKIFLPVTLRLGGSP
jgi:hypothetical protein